MKNIIDNKYFSELAAKDPANICKRAGCRYDYNEKIYKICFWGDEYSIYPIRKKVECISAEKPATHDYFQIFMIHYLLNEEVIHVSNEWISEKDIPGGSNFFTVPHEIPYHLIIREYGNDLLKFKTHCENMKGSFLDLADMAYFFNVTPRVPVAVLYWVGDDEFPPQSRLLFDKSISIFPLDVVFALAIEVCSRIGSRWTPYEKR